MEGGPMRMSMETALECVEGMLWYMASAEIDNLPDHDRDSIEGIMHKHQDTFIGAIKDSGAHGGAALESANGEAGGFTDSKTGVRIPRREILEFAAPRWIDVHHDPVAKGEFQEGVAHALRDIRLLDRGTPIAEGAMGSRNPRSDEYLEGYGMVIEGMGESRIEDPR